MSAARNVGYYLSISDVLVSACAKISDDCIHLTVVTRTKTSDNVDCIGSTRRSSLRRRYKKARSCGGFTWL